MRRTNAAFRVALVALASAPLLAPVASAAADAASKQAQKAVKTELKAFRAELAPQVDAFETAIAAFETAVVPTGAGRIEAVQDLLDAWNAVHVPVRTALHGVLSGSASGMSDPLVAVQAGASLGPYPAAFHPGGGGAFDALDAGWRGELARAQAAMAKPFAKLRKRLGKEHGIALTVQMRGSDFSAGVRLNVDAGVPNISISTGPKPRLELVVSVSDLATPGDAVIGLAGTGRFGETMHVELDAGGGLPFVADAAADDAFRWATVLHDVPEANYNLVLQTTLSTQTLDAVPLGVR